MIKPIATFTFMLLYSFNVHAKSLISKVTSQENESCKLKTNLTVDSIMAIDAIEQQNNGILFLVSEFSIFSTSESSTPVVINIGESLKLEHHDLAGSMVIIYTFCSLEDGVLALGLSLRSMEGEKTSKTETILSKVLINLPQQ